MRRHLNYANVVATFALVFAMSGGALAAKHYLINSTKQINPKVIKSLKGNAGPAGPAGSQGKEGPSGKEGPQGKEGGVGKEGKEGKQGEPGPGARWALISSNHEEILAQSGGISIAAKSGAGVYLNMGADVNGDVIEATEAYTNADEGEKGPIQATICGEGPYDATCTVAGTNDTHHVWVFTENSGGTSGEDHSFYVSVF